jgi:hypothetical protein
MSRHWSYVIEPSSIHARHVRLPVAIRLARDLLGLLRDVVEPEGAGARGAGEHEGQPASFIDRFRSGRENVRMRSPHRLQHLRQLMAGVVDDQLALGPFGRERFHARQRHGVVEAAGDHQRGHRDPARRVCGARRRADPRRAVPRARARSA